MTLFPMAQANPFALSAAVILRAAFELLLHGIRRPGQRAALCRATGRVVPR